MNKLVSSSNNLDCLKLRSIVQIIDIKYKTRDQELSLVALHIIYDEKKIYGYFSLQIGTSRKK